MEIASLNLAASAVPSTSLQASGYETVGFGKRAGARILDMVIHFGVGLGSGLFVALVLVVASAVTGTEPEIGKSSVLAFVLSLFGSILYESICEGLHGSTAGKYLLGLVVLREEGRPCTYVQAVGRAFAFFIDSLFFGLVGYLSMKDSPRDQRFGDKWCGTVVVTRASAPAGVLRGPGRFVGVFFLALFLDGIAITAGALL